MTSVWLPVDGGWGFGYQKFNRRVEDWAMVGVCALVRKAADGSCEDVRVGLTNMGSTPLRATATEQALRGGGLDGAASWPRRSRRRRAPTPERPERVQRLQAPPGSGPHRTRAGGRSGLRLTATLEESGRGGGRHAEPASPVAAVTDALAAERTSPTRRCRSLYLAATLEQPLLLEGEAGVGKTEVAKALAATTGSRLIRLQCYEGIDVHHALYDWDYARQLLALRAAEGGADVGELFAAPFLIRRPLLEALDHEGPVVLLIDEVDRADDEFEAFLLELLSDFQVTIPELGTVRAKGRPLVVITSNRTRELHDALKRRCLYHWIDYPTREREAEIVVARLPGVPEAIAERVCDAVALLRDRDLYKVPGVGETHRLGPGPARAGRRGRLARRLGRRRAEGARGHRAGARRRRARRCLRRAVVTERLSTLAERLRADGVRVGAGRAAGRPPRPLRDRRLVARAVLLCPARGHVLARRRPAGVRRGLRRGLRARRGTTPST